MSESNEATVRSWKELREVLATVRVRGVVDWGWRWWCEDEARDGDGDTLGWVLFATFIRPEIDTLVPGEGVTRKEFIARGASVSAVLKTVFVILRLTVEHELMEGFTVLDARPFNPHHTIGELAAVRGPVAKEAKC